MSAGYRLRQFWLATTARISAGERQAARRLLGPAASDLFERMPRADQRHGLDVMQALAAAGEREPAVLAAALLHDAGKAGAGLTVWHRTAIVLLGRWWPAGLARLAAPAGWRRPFWAHLRHAELGAQAAEAAGCAELTVWLIRHHHAAAGEELDAGRRALLLTFQRQDGKH